ncbi:hypothetical protein GUITHDRAFT_145932 [Guillardia theta CCMP2712]|uniref:SF3 helicase domain-containing protein n=1 Tax=Guillardia theta (strain CCMP2712) TaxID=905079 RepID=L1IJ34_GUITC|nr:hypothetical protein GUITHDRAFT_145932 [Guillardia theta CCMP2712]EKX36251.1 hypothetical protein GUITHDRAFT_145932 [Guillardia theta CCMP2712]|eukprot:XP_005823231.1 hypothetical protein GUITHDRAFT_145932 [Guillardia theta CCMP2712]
MDELNYFIDASLLQPTDFDIAVLIASYYNLDIIDYKDKAYPDIVMNNTLIKYVGNRIWYVYMDSINRWIETTESILSNNISTVIVSLYGNRKKHYVAKMRNEKDDLMKERYTKMSAQCDNIITLLKQSGKKDNYIKEVKYLLCDNYFIEKLDTKEHLLGFKNGVYDFEKGVFRKGQPTDYISLSTRYDYIEYNPEDKTQKELERYISQVYADDDVKEYVMNILGMAACCGKMEQFNIFWGDSGANGKSTFMSLLQKAFGDYAKTLPVALFTQKRAASNAACAEVERLKGARLVTTSEPDEDDVFNVGIVKEYTGNDMITARGLYKTPVEFRLMAKFILCCNKFPKRRQTTGQHQKQNFFKKDPNIDKKLEKFPAYLMSLIIHNIQKIYPELEFDVPESVQYNTNQYQKDTDLFRQFLTEEVIALDKKDSNKNNKLLISNLYSRFMKWLKSNASISVNVTRQDVKRKLEQNAYVISRDEKYVLYCKMRMEEESDEEDDEPSNNQTETEDNDIVAVFQHWLKHKFLPVIDITNVDDIHNRIPTQYIYSMFLSEYNKPVSNNEQAMIYDVMCDYFETVHNIIKKNAKNTFRNQAMCLCGIKMKS